MEIDHLPRCPGIYCIRNMQNGKRYVGSSVNMHKRAKEHRSVLNRGMHGNQYLQRSWSAATQAFVVSVLETCSLEDLIAREQHHIDLLRVCDPVYGYNLSATASPVTHSEATRRKISERLVGKVRTPEMCRRQSEARIGKKLGPHSEETKRKIGLGNSGKIRTAEMRKKMSDVKKGTKRSPESIEKTAASRRGKPGKPRSAETRAKISFILRGLHLSEEQRAELKEQRWSEDRRAKHSLALRGRVVTPETRMKIALSNRGQVRSEEARRKMSESAKLRKRFPRTPEHQAKLNAALKGHVVSAATRQKISDSLKRRAAIA